VQRAAVHARTDAHTPAHRFRKVGQHLRVGPRRSHAGQLEIGAAGERRERLDEVARAFGWQPLPHEQKPPHARGGSTIHEALWLDAFAR
jgi:hypothetical protein